MPRIKLSVEDINRILAMLHASGNIPLYSRLVAACGAKEVR